MIDERKDSDELRQAILNANPPLFPDLTEVNKNLKAQAKLNVAHSPRQQGPYIICVSCQNKHTLAWIGATKKLVGLDAKGGYIIENRF